jgi:hypothetical protein
MSLAGRLAWHQREAVAGTCEVTLAPRVKRNFENDEDNNRRDDRGSRRRDARERASLPERASLQYYPQYQYDPGPAIARGIFGAVVGPAIPASAGGYAYAPAYGYTIQPYCNPGFYWTGQTCLPYR